jgi:hypothetical protein
MKNYIAIFGVLGLAASALPSTAMAGGAEGATLLPTLDAIACTAEVTVPNCESDGYGAAVTLKIGRANYLGIDVTNLLGSQVYMVANNDVGLESCAGVLDTFTTTAAGDRNVTFPVSSAAGFVSICRESDGVLVPVLTGQMGRLNGK